MRKLGEFLCVAHQLAGRRSMWSDGLLGHEGGPGILFDSSLASGDSNAQLFGRRRGAEFWGAMAEALNALCQALPRIVGGRR